MASGGVVPNVEIRGGDVAGESAETALPDVEIGDRTGSVYELGDAGA